MRRICRDPAITVQFFSNTNWSGEFLTSILEHVFASFVGNVNTKSRVNSSACIVTRELVSAIAWHYKSTGTGTCVYNYRVCSKHFGMHGSHHGTNRLKFLHTHAQIFTHKRTNKNSKMYIDKRCATQLPSLKVNEWGGRGRRLHHHSGNGCSMPRFDGGNVRPGTKCPKLLYHSCYRYTPNQMPTCRPRRPCRPCWWCQRCRRLLRMKQNRTSMSVQ